MILLRILTLIFALIGTPLFIVIAAATIICFHTAGIDISAIMIEIYRMANAPMLMALPLFAFAGIILAKSNAPRRLLRVSNAIFGWFPGGLAIVSLITCAFFTAFTGASGITIIALGGLLLPSLLREKYPETFSLGLLTTSGSLGLLFPPSLPLIIYGIVAKTSIDQLFLAGIVPGIFLVILLSLFSILKGINAKVPRQAFSFIELLRAIKEAIWEIPLPIVVLGGVYSGYIAISEAATITAFYALLVEVFIKGDVKIKDLFKIIQQSMILVGSILIILGCALAFTNYLIDAEVPMRILSFFKAHITSKFLFLILLNIFLLIVGCMMDIFSALTIVVPLIVPIAKAYGINLLHLGIIFLTNLEIGYSTPPVGINLFISSLFFERPILKLYLASLPFLAILIFALIVITYVPDLSLFLVRVVSGQ
ncbi:MAG: TRAP transporter large permease subunit [Deltaproteobacteria bacterium]|nr:TRAP transporter large permease subunit [Deltaproteobacteria bacterium]